MAEINNEVSWRILSERAFSNLAVLATTEEKAISLWRSIKGWGAKGEMEAHFISEMPTLFEGFVTEVFKGRARPTHLAALAARGRELSYAHRQRLCQSRQVTVSRAVAPHPWIGEMKPEDRLNLVYARDADTRAMIASARFLPEDERIAALMATDSEGTPWYEIGWSDPLAASWYRKLTVLDLPVAQTVRSHSIALHVSFADNGIDFMGAGTRRVWFRQMADIMSYFVEHPVRVEVYVLKGFHEKIVDIGPKLGTVADAQLKELAKQVTEINNRDQQRPSYYRMTREAIQVVAQTWRKVAESVTGPAEDTRHTLPDDVIEAGTLTEIAARHAISPLTPEEAKVLAKRGLVRSGTRHDRTPLYTEHVARALVEMEVSSEVAAAFYRACVDHGFSFALVPSDEFVALMTTRDAVSNLLVPVALERLRPEQLVEAIDDDNNDLWHETATKWPDTLGSLLTITGD